jgi:hypothetical protein
MKVNPSDCSCDKLINIAKSCGFQIKEGGKHTKVMSNDGKLITTIPRKNSLNKYTAKGIIESFQKHNCEI